LRVRDRICLPHSQKESKATGNTGNVAGRKRNANHSRVMGKQWENGEHAGQKIPFLFYMSHSHSERKNIKRPHCQKKRDIYATEKPLKKRHIPNDVLMLALARKSLERRSAKKEKKGRRKIYSSKSRLVLKSCSTSPTRGGGPKLSRKGGLGRICGRGKACDGRQTKRG